MPPKTHTTTGPVELFPQPGGWHFVRVPAELSERLKPYADRGLVAITAEVALPEANHSDQKTISWKTSLLPMGDGTTFIALKKSVRQAAGLKLGKPVTVQFRLRER